MVARRASIHRPIVSRRAPRPLGVGALAVRVQAAAAQLFVGQLLPVEMPRGKVSRAPLPRQAELLLTHLRCVLADAGFVLDEVVSVTLWLRELGDLAAVDEVWPKFFVGQAAVARSVVQVQALPEGAALALAAVAMQAAGPAAPAEPPAPDEHDFY